MTFDLNTINYCFNLFGIIGFSNICIAQCKKTLYDVYWIHCHWHCMENWIFLPSCETCFKVKIFCKLSWKKNFSKKTPTILSLSSDDIRDNVTWHIYVKRIILLLSEHYEVVDELRIISQVSWQILSMLAVCCSTIRPTELQHVSGQFLEDFS